MGDRNQIIFLRRFLSEAPGPVLEVGSKEYGSTSSFREIYPHAEYLGVDLEPGDGVDEVVDLAAGIGSLPEDHFGLVVCCSVLEHTPVPWRMAENLTRLTAPGGKLYVSAPWVWRYHAYPDDYFRFSFRGVAALFPGFDWAPAYYSTNVEGEFIAIDAADPHADDRQAKYLSLEGKKPRKYLPYLMVNLLGTKR